MQINFKILFNDKILSAAGFFYFLILNNCFEILCKRKVFIKMNFYLREKSGYDYVVDEVIGFTTD